MDTTARFWDRIAEKYAAAPVRDTDAYETTLRRTRSHLHPEDRVLELGCGTGTTAVKLAGAAGEITATDVSEAMLAIGRQRAAEARVANVAFARQAAGDLPDGRPYDAVLAFNLLHLLPDLDAALARVAGALRPGGVFISKTVCLGGRLPLKYRAMLLALPVMQSVGKAPWVARLKVADLERRIAAAGFDLVETGDYPAVPPSRFVVARRRE